MEVRLIYESGKILFSSCPLPPQGWGQSRRPKRWLRPLVIILSSDRKVLNGGHLDEEGSGFRAVAVVLDLLAAPLRSLLASCAGQVIPVVPTRRRAIVDSTLGTGLSTFKAHTHQVASSKALPLALMPQLSRIRATSSGRSP